MVVMGGNPSPTPTPTRSGPPPAVAQAATTSPSPVPPSATAAPAPTTTPSAPPPTAGPSATRTPRPRPASTVYKRLQDYPRPAGDSGYGFHINAAPYPPKRDQLQSQIIPLMKSLGATWVTVYVSSADVAEWIDSVKLLVDSGFEVIVRYHPTNQSPHPDFVPTVDAIQRFRAVGVHYFVTGNEPNLGLENPSRAAPDLIAQQWIASSDRIKAAGGIPMLYPMSPGGGGPDYDAHLMLVGILDWLKANDSLDSLDGAAIAIHNRPHGKPLDVRDSTSFLDYEWIDDTVASYIGKHIPLIGTEAGYAFGEQTLAIYPRVDGELHKQYNLAIITGFRDGRWRDSLFAQTFWILSGFGYREFISDWWVENLLNFGKDLPIVDALKALPKFTRKFSETGFQTRPRN
jgi:hypothetical protein